MKQYTLMLALLFLGATTIGAQRSISGKVTDEYGNELIGATILVKNANVGTVTDIDGKYTLALPGNANAIVVTYTGFETRELEIGTSNVLNITLNAEKASLDGDTYTDSRDGEVYKIKTYSKDIGYGVVVRQTWMVENLRYDAGSGAVYHKDLRKKPADMKKYGRLYTWDAAKKACPPGWHLPSDLEWQKFLHLQAPGGLTSDNERAIYSLLMNGGSSGFSVLLGGYLKGDDQTHLNFGRFGYFWTSTSEKSREAFRYHFDRSGSESILRISSGENWGFSCRCIKD